MRLYQPFFRRALNFLCACTGFGCFRTKICRGIAPFALLLFLLITLYPCPLTAQNVYSKVIVNKQMKDTFSFATRWEYSPNVFKNEVTGEFESCCGDSITPKDTAHLFYTASCYTNVQGGYNIQYCYAKKQQGGLVLKLADGLPAYASDFLLYIRNDSFYFQPRTIYPLYYPGQKITYQITKQHLVLNTIHPRAGEVIMGYADLVFVEKVTLPGRGIKKHTFYVKGYIRTTLPR